MRHFEKLSKSILTELMENVFGLFVDGSFRDALTAHDPHPPSPHEILVLFNLI